MCAFSHSSITHYAPVTSCWGSKDEKSMMPASKNNPVGRPIKGELQKWSAPIGVFEVGARRREAPSSGQVGPRRSKPGKASWASALGGTQEITNPGEGTSHHPAAQVTC